jgi:hypothetical protein
MANVGPGFLFSRDGPEPIVDVDRVEQIETAIRPVDLGRYHIDEIIAEPLTSGHTSRRSGIRIKREDGTVAVELYPYLAARAMTRLRC